MDVLDNGQLLKRVTESGDPDSSRPERGCKVTIRLTTWIKSTGETGSICGGLQRDARLLPMMQDKEVAQVMIHERFAYNCLPFNVFPPNPLAAATSVSC